MKYRKLGKTGWDVSAISFGAWAIGGSWGPNEDAASMKSLHAALDAGVNLFDTADVYGDGHSERLLARLRAERSEPFYVATKAGRRLSPHVAEGYSLANLTAFVDRSLSNLKTDRIDLLQIHCPPSPVYYMPETFGALEGLVQAGKIAHYGASVEKVEEALKAIEYPGVATIQIIFNMFRQRPRDLFFAEAARRDVGILARLPLSSGMLTGKLTQESTFAPTDHRAFNRHGEAFDQGETFSGIDYPSALEAVEELKSFPTGGVPLSAVALRWILMFPEVSCAIPGGRTPEQVRQNCAAADLPDLESSFMESVDALYRKAIRPLVHDRW